jgi:hypothetical protein
MQTQTVTFLVAGISGGVSLITYWLTKASQDSKARREERRQEYRELLSTLTSSYMRIVSPYEPPIPVIDEETQKQILEAKLLAFRILQDRIAIAEELEESGVLDAWTEALVSLERNADSVSFAKKFRPIREKITRMANRPPPGRHRLRELYQRIRYFREIREYKQRRDFA